MWVPCMNGILAATVAAASVIRSTAFICVPKPTFEVGPHLALQHRASHLAASRATAVGNTESVVRYSRPSRRDCYRRSAPRTILSAQDDGPPPGEARGGIPKLPSLPGMKTVVETAEEEEQRAAREWQDDGRKGRVLVRRKEIPTPEKEPGGVCQLVFQSLQNNDDPMLDYGAAVAIKFASSKNAVKGMTPAEYGAFLRNDPDQGLLVDNAICRPAERAKVSADGKQVLQKIELVGAYPDDIKRIVDVQLSKEEDDCWRIDAISFPPL